MAKNKIEYTYTSTSSFRLENENIEFTKLEIINTGSQTQHSIQAEVVFKGGAIQEFSIPAESKSANPLVTISENKEKILIKTDNLFTKETIKIEILVKTKKKENPYINIRSKTTKGTKLSKPNTKTDQIFNDTTKSIALIIISLFIFTILLRKKTIRFQAHSPNNIGFLLLHANEINVAGKYFEKDLEKGITGPYSLSNYALYKALTDSPNASKPYIEAALFYSNNKHEKAVSKFNESLILAINNETSDAEEKLAESIKLSKSSITKYCNYSKIVKEFIPNFQKVIDESK
ncbi:hypothetical protein [Pseudomonas sp. TTU2014-080ASC]|uniref:hypothetical protein n=1 Tax=Pseudomonas sp. TTU2014-080ASC TaxID=1729724 RepID=UPI00071877C6|nr:hypothetical protein [Pseudomonas sp. TTU2014-080ASC]KRW59351.1 hypothetical protein AO726_11025 [Pseudomonas sp. TTU2014-080ASC]